MHTLSIRVYYEDTDAGGIVYYANYLKFAERARTEGLRDLGFEQDELLEQNIAFVVKHVEMHNYAPARFNQLLSIETRVVELKGASMTFQQIIKNEQEINWKWLGIEGEMTRTWSENERKLTRKFG